MEDARSAVQQACVRWAQQGGKGWYYDVISSAHQAL